MASESVIDVEGLLEPVPGDNPAGEPAPFQVRKELDELREEVDPDRFSPDDPARPTEAKKADWPGIVRVGTAALRDSSKDLLIAARVVEALTHQHGFAGLADGLALLRGLVERCWDRVHPMYPEGSPEDPESIEDRAGRFRVLEDVRFTAAVRMVPLVRGREGPIGLEDIQPTDKNHKPVAGEVLKEAVAASPAADCQRTFDDLTRCVSELNELNRVLGEKMRGAAPGLTDLKAALGGCYTVAKQIAQQKGPAADEAPAEANGEPAADGAAAPARAVTSRAEAYRRLAEAADLLERLEPHSPIPYLVRRAVKLGSLPFPLLMRALIRNDEVITEMNRELDIPAPPPAEE